MSDDGIRPSTPLALRVARARREAGLSKMALTERIGVRLFMVDRYEAGSPIPEDQLEATARATGHSVE